ncbi:unnamed protein product, partial [Rotaria sp. Silwood1]
MTSRIAIVGPNGVD